MREGKTKMVFLFGPGGVGKTTIASALGIGLAKTGYNTLVVTVDPAKRLRDVLRIKEIGFEPVSLNRFYKEETNCEILGNVDAMMIDSKNAFLNLLRRYITNEDVINNIISNRIFRFLSESLIGAQEYLAAEKIYDIFLSNQYDIIVVDTAPSKNAFEFIDGASKMAEFLDKKVIRFFVDTSDSDSIKSLFIKKTGKFLYKILGIIFGEEFIADMKGFLNNMTEMYDDLLKRAYELSALYLSDNVKYVIIGSPQKLSLGELNHLQKGLHQRGITEITMVLNRAPYFWGREDLISQLNMMMTNLKNSDIKYNLEFILSLEREMLESAKRDLESRSHAVGTRRIVLPDLYTDISNFEQLSKLGDIMRGGFNI
ncbi:MAG: AAA family ATPase [Deltaproteobacteria bacterium]|nr:AAA family ATPase [Deltaproteobacteria bacterium]